MKILAFLAGALALLVLFFAGIFHEIAAEDAREQAQRHDWRDFSAAHHCKIAHASTFWEASSIWECDGGFQVRRNDNE